MSESRPLRELVTQLLNLFESGDHIPDTHYVSGRLVQPYVSFARPADTTAYAIGDVISHATSGNKILEFEGAFRLAGGTGKLQTAMLIDVSNETTKLAANLWLFSSPVTIEGDNAKWTPTEDELLSLQAVVQWAAADAIQSDVTANVDGNVVNVQKDLALPIKGIDTKLYGVLTAANTYTPVSAERLIIRLSILPD